MFSSSARRRSGTITVHPALRRAVTLARAFLLLEDSESSAPRTPGGGMPEHPHRAPLRPLAGTRRPGGGVPRAQPCRSPLPGKPDAQAGRRRTPAPGRAR